MRSVRILAIITFVLLLAYYILRALAVQCSGPECETLHPLFAPVAPRGPYPRRHHRLPCHRRIQGAASDRLAGRTHRLHDSQRRRSHRQRIHLPR